MNFWEHGVQGILSAYQRGAESQWHNENSKWQIEKRNWRTEDIAWRDTEKAAKNREKNRRTCVKQYFEEDMEFKNLQNARTLWLRFVEKNRREVEEKSEQLRAMSSLSAVFALFAVVTLTQLKLDNQKDSLVLIFIYAMLTAIVEGCMTVTTILCTFLLITVIKRGKHYVDETAEQNFIISCAMFCKKYSPGKRPPAPHQSLQKFWDYRCETTWNFAFYNCCWGISAFLLSMGPVGWITFEDSSVITSASFLVVIFFALLSWIYVFNNRGVYLKAKTNESVNEDLDDFSGLPYDWHLCPTNNQHSNSNNNN